MTKYDLTISIVLYNTCIVEVNNIIDKFTLMSLKYKIFIIDNSPRDNLRDNFQNRHDFVEYIYTGKNIGFGSGHNLAINLIKNCSNFHLVLNADVDFEPSILNTIHEYMNKFDNIGLISPKILNMDGSVQYSAKLLPTPINLIVRRFIPIKKIQEYFNYKYELRFSNFNKIIDIPYVMGCFMFINCKVFQDVEGFDERFFMYPEDIDLTRRIHEKYRTIYFPDVTIFHKHGRGSYNNYKLF